MQLPVFIIDTFTPVKFKGNPTAVCVTENQLPAEMMHTIANELNFPVTAFVNSHKRNGNYELRYFTSTGEIPACGHATLAAAKVMFEMTANKASNFVTTENIVIITNLKEDFVFMTYPKYEMTAFNVSENTLRSLGVNNYKSAGFCEELETLFIELENPQTLKALQPDFKMLADSSNQIKEVVVTSVSDNNRFDFLLRSFCPWIGINEDPVTGSVHSVLAHFWKDKLGKSNLMAYQASERGGEVYVKSFENNVELGGKAITLLKGELNV